jgi:GNAT superfamily N-acetyltransferase
LDVEESELYRRGRNTLLASWEAYARGSPDARVVRGGGFAAAVFPSEPERSVYNNVVLDRGLGRDERRKAVEEVESLYSEAGVDRYAAWAHETDAAMRAELTERGHRLTETTRAMGRSLDTPPPARTEAEVETFTWPRYLAYLEAESLPSGLLSGVDPDAFRVLGIRVGGEDVATAICFDHEGDCGVFNMGTLEPYRRRGLAAALLARHLQDAAGRGCSTATLQSTPVAEGVYGAAGFRDLGRFFEYAPAG